MAGRLPRPVFPTAGRESGDLVAAGRVPAFARRNIGGCRAAASARQGQRAIAERLLPMLDEGHGIPPAAPFAGDFRVRGDLRAGADFYDVRE